MGNEAYERSSAGAVQRLQWSGPEFSRVFIRG